MAVTIFFFIYVDDPKHLLSQTQKFNNVFLWKTKKGRFSERKTLWKPPWNSVPPVRFRAVGRNRRLASFYFCINSNFEKVRKTAKNEENPRKSRVFRPASFKTGTLGCYGLKRWRFAFVIFTNRNLCFYIKILHRTKTIFNKMSKCKIIWYKSGMSFVLLAGIIWTVFLKQSLYPFNFFSEAPKIV